MANGRKQGWRSRITRYGEEAPDQLLAHPLNWRTHPADQQNALAGVLDEVGVVQNVIVNERTGHVVDGHLRIALAMRNDQPTIPVTYVDLDEAEEALILATLDPVAAMAGQDAANLAELLTLIDTDNADIQALLDSLGGEVETIDGGLTDPDDVPSVPDDPITKPGDLWLLGRHRLLCGDATVITDVERLMGGEKADMVFTDPPYGMNLQTDSRGHTNYKSTIGGRTHRSYVSVIGDDAEFDASFLIEHFRGVSEQFWWGADYYRTTIPIGGSWVVWDKTGGHDGLMDAGFGSNFELCWSKTPHKRDIARVTYKGVAGMKPEDGTRQHPTQKPVGLASWFFERWGKPNDLVLDLFGGSGSTLIACEQTGRRCAMMELDPHYCDVIRERFERFTGQTATLAVEAMAAD